MQTQVAEKPVVKETVSKSSSTASSGNVEIVEMDRTQINCRSHGDE